MFSLKNMAVDHVSETEEFLHFCTFLSEEMWSSYFFDVIIYQGPTGSAKFFCV